MQEFPQKYFLFGSLTRRSVQDYPERGSCFPQEPFIFKWLAILKVSI